MKNRHPQTLGALRPRPRAIAAAIGHVLLGGAVAAAVAAAPGAARAQATPAANAEAARSHSIPAGSLEEALTRFGREAGILLSFSADATAGLRSGGLQGSHTVRSGLDALLAGSGLQAVRQPNGSYTLAPAAAGPAARPGEAALPAVTVRGQAEPGPGVAGGQGLVARRGSTAAKTPTPILETPQTVHVVTAGQIEAQGATSIDQALRYTPGVATDFYGAATYNDYLRLRGFSTPMYLDGLRTPSGLRNYATLRVEPYGLEQIEILKGPSSALYGQATPGGLVNAVRKRPVAEPVREVEIQAGSFNRVQGSFDLGGAIDPGQTLLFRLTGLARDGDTQADFLQDRREFIAPSLTWRPSGDTRWTVFAHHQSDIGGNSPLPALGTLQPTALGSLPVSTFLGYTDFNRYEREQASIGHEIEQRLGGGLQARHKLEYARIEMDYRYPVLSGAQLIPETGSVLLNRSIQHTRDTATSLTVDNHLQFDLASGALNQTLLLGLDYARLDFDAFWGGDYTGGQVDAFHPRHTGRPPDPGLAPDQSGAQYQAGLHAQNQIRWADWTLSLGGRHDWARSSVYNANVGTTTVQRDEAFTGRIGLVRRFDSGVAPYVSYSTSFEPTAGADAAGAAFKPTTAD